MADIKEIDYDQIINKASQIASSANDMQNAVKEAFKKIEEMSGDWFGQSYDNFINTVNMSISGLNQIFEVSVSDIPHEISAKAKSYAAGNQASVGASFNDQTALMLNELPKTNKGSKLRFRSAEVSSDQSAIKSKFEEAKSNADKALNTSTSLESVWQSISGDTNITELQNAFAKLKSILESLAIALDDQITAQTNTIEAIEGAADMVESAKNMAEDAVDAAKEAGANAVEYIKESAEQVWKNLTGKN